MLLFELRQEIWGESPATRSIDSSIETGDLMESSSQPSTSTEMPSSPNSPTESLDCLPHALVKQRRGLLQAKLDSHRGDRLKRKAQADLAEEDLRIKRRMLELTEESARAHSENMARINTNIANITSTIQDGFSPMKELLLRPQSVHPHSSNEQFYGYPPAYIRTTPHPTTPAFLHTPTPNQPAYQPGRYNPTPKRSPENENTFSFRRALLQNDVE